MIAYRAAGLETILVTWGIKYRFNRNYSADHVFNTPEELLEFLNESIGNYPLNLATNELPMVAEMTLNLDDDLPF